MVEWVDSPTAGLTITVLLGAATGFTALVLWFRLLRHSPKLTHALDLDSTVESPIVALAAAEPGEPPVADDAPADPSTPG